MSSPRPLFAPILLMLPLSAQAIELDLVIDHWSETIAGAAGEDGQDAATGVALDTTGEVVAVGWLDGNAGRQDNAYIVRYDAEGVETLSLLNQSGPLGTRATAEDRWTAVGLTSDGFAVSGYVAAPEPMAADQLYVAARYDDAGGEVWVDDYVDGPSSLFQAAEGVAVQFNDDVVSAGWADHGAGTMGQWIMFTYTGLLGTPLRFTYNFSILDFERDRAMAVGLGDGDMMHVVGVVGRTGSIGAQDNDTDAFIRKLDLTGLVQWEEPYGESVLEDAFTAVAVDAVGDVYAVGYENAGTDNAANADYNWLIVKYGRDGAYGAGDRLWVVHWESATGASEQALAVDVDDDGNPIVGGWAIDAGTGNRVWKVVSFDSADGDVLTEWTGPVAAGDATLNALDVDGTKLAMAGTIDDGTQGDDFAVHLVEQDTDGDNVADSEDFCVDDPTKSVDGGFCGCGIPDDDTDGDGALDCEEECDIDVNKTDPGVCGCNEEDIDSDGDGTEDCIDNCPDDPDKVSVGVCGCNAPDADSDGDGVLDCNDACSDTEPGTVVNQFGCPPEDPTDTGTTDTDSDTDTGGDGCGCVAAPTPLSGLALLPVALLGLRRRP